MKPNAKQKRNKRLSLLGKFKGLFIVLGAFGVFLTSLLSLSWNVTSKTISKEQVVTDKSQTNLNESKSSFTTPRILTEGTYDKNYTTKLNADVQKASEPVVSLPSYQWQKEAYQTFVDEKNSSYLGSYSYQIREESFETKEIEKAPTYSDTHSHFYTMNKKLYAKDNDKGPGVDVKLFMELFDGSTKLASDYNYYYDIDPDHNPSGWTGYKNFVFNKQLGLNDHIQFKIKTEWSDRYEFLGFYPRYYLPSNAYDIKLKKVRVDFKYDTSWYYYHTSKTYDIYFNVKTVEPHLTFEYKVPKTIYPSQSKTIYYHPVYVGENYLQTHNFTNDELKSLIKFGGINTSDFELINLALDKANKKISGQYYIRNLDSQHSAPWQSFEIPVLINSLEENEKEIKAKPVFINELDYQTKNFTSDELGNLIQFKDIDMENVGFTNLTLDKANNKITGSYKISNLDPKQVNVEYQTFEVPVKTFNFDYLLTLSPESATQWQHLENGKLQYWQKPPTTVVRYNNEWIYSLYTYNKQKDIKNQFKQEQNVWNLDENQTQILNQKLESYALNFWNYNQVRKKWTDNGNFNEIKFLQAKPFLVTYQHLKNVNLNDYLYILKNGGFQFSVFENGSYFNSNQINLSRFSSQNVSLSQGLVDKNPSKTHWKVKFSNFILNFWSSNIFTSRTSNSFLKFKDVKNKNYEQLHDVKIAVDSLNPKAIYHEYFFQAQGVDLKQDISFKLADGTILDQDFIVVEKGQDSLLDIGDYGFVNTRYWAKFPDEHEEYLLLEWQNNQWYSGKYQKPIQDIDPSFQYDQLEYVFNQNLNMVVNPYSKTLDPKQDPITASDIPRYGIEKVVDVQTTGGKEETRTLESWDSGKFSHTSTIEGKALFDGVFGADTRGFYDPVGFLTDGKHKIAIQLKNLVSDLKTMFNIVIDNTTLRYEVQSPGLLTETVINDQQGSYKKLYFANEPVSLLVDAKDIKQVKAEILHSSGSWYEIPVYVKSVKKGKEWLQQIDSTFDYEGFARFTLIDYAGNSEVVYFLVNKNPDEQPKLTTSATLKTTFKDGNDVLFLNNALQKNLLTHPLVKNVQLSEISLDNQNNVVSQPKNDLIANYVFEQQEDYGYGSRITDEGATRLPYAADELTPFLGNLILNPDNQWLTCNKKLNLKANKLYKVTIDTWLVGNNQIIKYLYTNNQNQVEFIDENTFLLDQAYFGSLPIQKDQKTISGKDETQNLLATFFVNNFEFEIDDAQVLYSLPWFSSFNEIKLNLKTQNWKEGKYKVKITDVFGVEHTYQFLLINKALSEKDRDEQDLIFIYKEDQNEETAFWKGDFVWNIFRYEDKDHAKFAHDKFIQDALAAGLTLEEAELAYKMALSDDKWDGRFEGGPPDGSGDWKGFLENPTWKQKMQDALAKVTPPKVFLGGKSYDQKQYEDFKTEAKGDGLSDQEATLAFQMAKLDKGWGGEYTSGPPDESGDWKSFLKNPEWQKKFGESQKLQQPKKSQDNTWAIVGISVSSVVGSGVLAWLIWRHFRTRKIKH